MDLKKVYNASDATDDDDIDDGDDELQLIVRKASTVTYCTCTVQYSIFSAVPGKSLKLLRVLCPSLFEFILQIQKKKQFRVHSAIGKLIIFELKSYKLLRASL